MPAAERTIRSIRRLASKVPSSRCAGDFFNRRLTWRSFDLSERRPTVRLRQPWIDGGAPVETSPQPGSGRCDCRRNGSAIHAAGERGFYRSNLSLTGAPAVLAVFAGIYQRPISPSAQKSWSFSGAAHDKNSGCRRSGALYTGKRCHGSRVCVR